MTTAFPITTETGFGSADERSVSGGSGEPQSRSGGVGLMIADASRRLQSVSQRLRAFLHQKLKQFETVSLQCESIVSERDSLQRLREEVLRDKGEWEQRRQGQMDELRGEQDRLIEAWQKLEEQQRQILVQHDTQQLHAPPFSSSGVDALMPSFAAGGPSLPSTHEAKTNSVFAEAKHCYGPAPVNMPRETALDQFQRLKREVQKHVQRLQEISCKSGN